MHLLGIKRMTLALLAPYTIIFELYRILNVLFFLSIYYYIVHLESVCLLNTQSSWYEFVFGQRGVMTLLIKDLICPLSSSACTHTHIPLLLWGSEPTRSQIKATSQLPHQHYLQWFYTRGGERWFSRTTLLQSLAPTLKNPGGKIPDRILKTLISYFRCVWLGLELNSAGTSALQDQRPPPVLHSLPPLSCKVYLLQWTVFQKSNVNLTKITNKCTIMVF